MDDRTPVPDLQGKKTALACGTVPLLGGAGRKHKRLLRSTRVKHGGSTQVCQPTEGSELKNLALSCTLCNKHKGSDLSSIAPLTQKLESRFIRQLDNVQPFALEVENFFPFRKWLECQ
jgi:hypothetical protein